LQVIGATVAGVLIEHCTVHVLHLWLEMKGVEPPSFQLNIGDELDLENVFAVFKKVQMLTDTAKAVELATYLTIKEFFADGVKYLELRSTPRGKWYVEAVLAGMQKAMDHIQIVVRYLPSIDRARNLEHVQLILEMVNEIQSPLIVGIDVSGDPQRNDTHHEIIKTLQVAKDKGLKIAAHIGESPGSLEYASDLIKVTDRIGHGTFLVSSPSFRDLCDGIPFELCLSSNVINKTVESYTDHHFGVLYKNKHPLCISTDDKGLISN